MHGFTPGVFSMWFALFLTPENLFTQGCQSGHALVLIVHIITLEFRCPALTSLKLLQWASFISLECLFVICLAFYFGLLVCWTAFAFILACRVYGGGYSAY